MPYDVMTEADREVEFERLSRLMDKGEVTSVFCPWCSKMNTPDLQACCAAFQDAILKRGQAQLQSIMDQRKNVEIGLTGSIQCPYCHMNNRIPENGVDERHPSEWPRPMQSPFCCDLFQLAAYAIAERERQNQYIDQTRRIEDGAAKAARN